MKMKLLFLALFANVAVSAQIIETADVLVIGNIIDEKTKEPVEAKIKYESLPYGSKIGIFKGSEFSFNMLGGNNYLLVVDADGYAPHQETLYYDSAVNGELKKTVILRPTGINQLITLDKLIFGLGKANITEESYAQLNELVSMLNANPNITIQLEGHTDFRGNDKLNMELSEDRVEAVKDYLVKQGIDKRRIQTKAFGGTQPLSRASDAESRRRNRRVEVRILSN